MAAAARGSDQLGAKINSAIEMGRPIDLETQTMAVQTMLEDPELQVRQVPTCSQRVGRG